MEDIPQEVSMSSPSPIHFIFAAPRSGTTWLARALNHHPALFATEQRLFGNFGELWQDADGSRRARQTWDFWLQNFCHFYQEGLLGQHPTDEAKRDFLHQLTSSTCQYLIDFGLRNSGKRLVVDKVTPYLGTAGRVLKNISEFFPAAKIIHLIRDGRDVATSGAFDWLNRSDPSSEAYQYFVSKSRPDFPTRLFENAFLEDWCRYWKEPAAALDFRLKQGDFADTVLVVRYEDMLVDQARELQRICQFLEVDDSADICRSCRDAVTFEKITQRKQGVEVATAKARKGICGDWKNYFTRSDAELYQSQCGHWLHYYGYSRGQGWVAECAERLSKPEEAVQPADNNGDR